MLLILDNFEHLLAVGPALVDLLRAAARAHPAGHQPGAAAGLRRARHRRAAAGAPRSRRVAAGERTARVRRRAALRRAVPGGALRPSPSTTRTRPMWRRSAGGWTACRWRSSWPRLGSRCLPPHALLARLATPPALADRTARTTCRSGCGPCAPGSRGATTCSRRTSSASSAGWRSSPAGSRWPPRRPSVRATGRRAFDVVAGLVDKSLLQRITPDAAIRAS